MLQHHRLVIVFWFSSSTENVVNNTSAMESSGTGLDINTNSGELEGG